MSHASTPALPARVQTAGAIAVLAAAVLTGCSSAPPRGPSAPGVPAVVPRAGPASGSERDGPQARPPAGLERIPDAEPRVEPILRGGPNRPYELRGRDYVPIAEDRPFRERGLASWYGRKFHGRRTASGETYNMYAMTAAHPTLPLPSYARIVNPANGRAVVVRINDRGPFHPGRIVDLSYTAALKLGVLSGVRPVELTRLTFEDIRTGRWRNDAAPDAGAPEPAGTALASGGAAAGAAAGGTAGAAAAGAAGDSDPDPLATLIASRTRFDEAAGALVADAATADAVTPFAEAPAGFYVQLGAFRERDGAEGFHRRIVADLEDLAPQLAVFGVADGYRLKAGPYPSRRDAQTAARRVREALRLVPAIVERR